MNFLFHFHIFYHFDFCLQNSRKYFFRICYLSFRLLDLLLRLDLDFTMKQLMIQHHLSKIRCQYNVFIVNLPSVALHLGRLQLLRSTAVLKGQLALVASSTLDFDMLRSYLSSLISPLLPKCTLAHCFCFANSPSVDLGRNFQSLF